MYEIPLTIPLHFIILSMIQRFAGWSSTAIGNVHWLSSIWASVSKPHTSTSVFNFEFWSVAYHISFAYAIQRSKMFHTACILIIIIISSLHQVKVVSSNIGSPGLCFLVGTGSVGGCMDKYAFGYRYGLFSRAGTF